MFYTFYQNNSGGSFIISPKDHISVYVVIEANDVDHANQLAEDKGLYFDGCATGNDCDCCGDRWSRTWKDEGKQVPELYGDPIIDGVIPKDTMFGMKWARMGTPEGYIHYLDGTISSFDCTPEPSA